MLLPSTAESRDQVSESVKVAAAFTNESVILSIVTVCHWTNGDRDLRLVMIKETRISPSTPEGDGYTAISHSLGDHLSSLRSAPIASIWQCCHTEPQTSYLLVDAILINHQDIKEHGTALRALSELWQLMERQWFSKRWVNQELAESRLLGHDLVNRLESSKLPNEVRVLWYHGSWHDALKKVRS
jgi:hypothetical protein